MSTDDVNPYQTPAGDSGFVAEEPACPPSRRERQVSSLLDEDSLGNLQLTATATKFAAIFSFLSACVPITQMVALFRSYGLPRGWETVHTMTCIRFLYVPLWVILGRQLWKYSHAINSFCNTQEGKLETVIERQTKVWLAVQTLLMVIIFLLAMNFLYMSLLRVFN